MAAELGVLGLLAYAALLAGATVLIRRVHRLDPALGLGLAAVLLALFVHSLAYSGFFEDPITWLVLGIAAAQLALPLRRIEPVVRVTEPREAVPAR